jgi:hypothetical protein
MMHEIAVFLQRLAILVACIVLGVVVGGVWALTAVFRADAPAAVVRVLSKPNAVELALDAEEAFAESWPGQSYVVRSWGWSAVAAPTAHEDENTKTGDILGLFAEGLKSAEKGSARVEPWLRLVWIRGVGVIGILVAGLLPALAWWLVGRQRAYQLHMDTDTPSDGHRATWVGIAVALAFIAGVLVGAPIGSAMAPWIAITLLGSLATLFQIRACMAARL